MQWLFEFDPENVNSKDLHMPKELKTLHKFSSNLVRALPDFLDSTVSHRLKQVAHKSFRTISPTHANFKNLPESYDKLGM